MRNTISLLMLLAFAFVLNAAAPTTPTIYGPMNWQIAPRTNASGTQTNCVSGAWVYNVAAGTSINGTASLTLFTKMPIEPGWSYIVEMKDSIGAGDSIQIQMLRYGSDGSTLMETSYIDTLVASTTCKTFSIPLGLTKYGNCITVKAVGLTSGIYKKVYRVEVWRRSPSTKSLW